MCCELCFGGICLAIGLILFLNKVTASKKESVKGEHAIVTGGSSGIGLAVAIDLVKRGASVTLVARNQQKLDEAKVEVEKHRKDPIQQKVHVLSLDLASDFDEIVKAFNNAEKELGPVFMLVNNAGLAINARFHEMPIGDFKRSMDLNFLGSTYATRAVIPGMMERKRGRIVFVSSVAGQVGVFGYTAYSASKFALRGLAEALQMEMKPYNIRVTLSFPPDTDTPGFQKENETKPLETKLISETAGLFEAKDVAKRMVDDALQGKFLTYLGMDGWMVTNLTAGMGPPNSFIDTLIQFCTMGLFRVISLGYLTYFDNIVRKCHKAREAVEKVEGKKGK
jgi:3-dehydrosphinganine reductase